EPIATIDDLARMQAEVREVEIKQPVAEYLLRVVGKTRDHRDVELGVSPRGALALFRAAQARAYLARRRWAGPDDRHALAAPVLGHRVLLTTQARYGGTTADSVIAHIVKSVPVPT